MLQLVNRSALAAKILTLPDPDGVEALHVIVKATFALSPEAPLTREQRPVTLADEVVGEGARAWLRRPAEVHPPKPACEVLVEGDAVAPGGRAVPWVDASVVVGAWRRVVSVTGDRRYTGHERPWASAPVPFTRMPLTPDRAFGGVFKATGLTEMRNPVGVGVAPEDLRDLRGLRELPLPNVEDPAAPLARVGDRPRPTLVTPVAASWSPRAERAGTYDDAWNQRRAPFLPVDFDPRFLMTASEPMWLPERLRGGERVALEHLAENPVIEGRVPSLGPRVRARFRGAWRELPALAETLHLFPNEGVGTLVLRATLRCGHRALDVSAVEITTEAAR